MKKTKKITNQSRDKQQQRPRLFYSLQPWLCQHYPDRSDITAYVEASSHWEVVAVVQPTSGASAEALADFLVRLVNAHQKNQNLLRDAMEALEAVMQEGLNFATEQDAYSVVASIKQVIS